ncbi:MAG: sulfur transferase domain-containing protein [Pseudomonadota bacterium]
MKWRDLFADPHEAAVRRELRRQRWGRGITSRRERVEAWVSLILKDHGFLRLFYRNRHQVTPRLWRAAQPSPADIGAAKRLGVRTILSLRRDAFGGDALEREACERHGLAFARVVMTSRQAPSKEMLREAMATYKQLETPVLLHCKSGADRAGLATALWLIIMEGAPVADAAKALSPRYGHIRQSKTGILDHFVAEYGRTGEAAGLSLAEWVDRIYDPEALAASFTTNRTADRVLDAIGRE